METKGIVKRVGKVGNFHIFAAALSQQEAERRLHFFRGRSQLLMARLIETGRLSLTDVKEAERLLEKTRNGKANK
jgi:hypothetical protein